MATRYGDGVFRSTNSGASWTAANTGFDYPPTVQVLAVAGKKLFAGTEPLGLFLWTNNGASWTATGWRQDVWRFAVSDTYLFIGDANLGVSLSTNNGTSWTVVNAGLSDSSVRALAVSGANLFAAARSGLWRRPLSEMITSAQSPSSQVPALFELQQNYPNPFNPSTTIKYELPKSSDVRLSVFDMLGREVSVLVNERRDAGVHEVKFDGLNLASGVYFYRLHAGDFVQTRKLLLLR